MFRKIKALCYLAQRHGRVVQLHFYLCYQLLVYQLFGCLTVKIVSYNISKITCGNTESLGIERHQMLPGTVLPHQAKELMAKQHLAALSRLSAISLRGI